MYVRLSLPYAPCGRTVLSWHTHRTLVTTRCARAQGYDIGLQVRVDARSGLTPGSDAATLEWHGQSVRRCAADVLVCGAVALQPEPSALHTGGTVTDGAASAGGDKGTASAGGVLAAEYNAAVRDARAVVTLVFDNTHSRFRSKTVMYRLRLRHSARSLSNPRYYRLHSSRNASCLAMQLTLSVAPTS